MVEQPHPIAAMVALGLGIGSLAILRGELPEQCTSALKIYSIFHIYLPGEDPMRNRSATTTAIPLLASRKICLGERIIAASIPLCK